ncbi:Cytochrome P450 [Macleaya cordata]|uniref:Cytochrome P450 n=1 Tax=Macleaya cordata TaxID=56857 RepID=A0A200QY85_MACCD|nr:Cytochrome P450 [Macleaya cordata]
MDSNLTYHDQFTTITTSIGIFALLLYFLLSWRPKKHKPSRIKAPEPTGSWPIIGHLHHLLLGSNLPHINLGAMADKYGPAFMIRIGLRPALVVSSWEVAREVFTTNDRVFASRPRQVAMNHMGYDCAMFGFAPYGPYWRELRKIVNKELLSNSRLELLKHVWDSEINTSFKELYKVWVMKNYKEDHLGGDTGGPVAVEMKRWFADLTLNMSVKMIVGKRYFGASSTTTSSTCADDQLGDDDEAGRCQKALRNFFRLLGLFVLSDAIPFLRWLDLGGYEREMKSTGKELDVIMEGWLEEHKRKRRLSSSASGDDQAATEKKEAAGGDDKQDDFMDVLLSILEDAKVSSDYFKADTINKSTCLMLILGGSDTTMVSLVWALALLVNHPHVLKKVHDELDIHVGNERLVDESDIKNLTYLQAVIKETMRLYPAGPLSGLRESTEDCTVAGYHVPAGTRLILNTWKIQRDPRVWSDPAEFKPERFLTTHVDVDVKGQNFELIPFGSGRRSCPGTSLALQVVSLTLARFIHGFEFSTPWNAPTDMTESAGLTNVKATPLEVLVTPRLPSKLYVG